MERFPGIFKAAWDALPAAFRAFIVALEREVVELRGLKVRVAQLEAQVSKNSANSHKPPSSDGPGKPPRTQSERKPSGKKPGGQPGHAGSTLRKSANPDARVRHRVDQCSGCSRDLSRRKPDSIEERQVFDLPPMRLVCTSHEAETKHCPDCGHVNCATWPEVLVAEPGVAIYGPELRAFGVYLTAGQLLPYERASALVEDLFGQKVSAGSLTAWTQKAAGALAATEQLIADALACDPGSVHFDETGCRTNGKNHWLHSASNEQLTYFGFHSKRGTEAIEEIGILPRFTGTAIHDRWGPYFQYENCSHGLCGAHLQRDLRFVAEQEEESWARSMKTCLLDMNDAVNMARHQGKTRFDGPTIAYWEGKYGRILKAGMRLHAEKNRVEGSVAIAGKCGRKKQRAGKNLLDALDKRREWVLLFLKDFSVPFTNNQGERDIRMTKVKIKVSGCFRSEDGARHFCRIRGYLSTARKQGWSLLEAIKSVFLGAPMRPAFTGTG
jgi:hypothetical protein